MTTTSSFPRILIGAPGSGSGKTLLTCALMRILSKRGYDLCGFKCGPDYIDPMFHKTVLGIPSRNLDLFLQGENGMKKALLKGAEEGTFGIIEGVMGFYDGTGAESFEGSNYDLCVRTKTPAILIVSCKGMSRSIVPVIKGFLEYGSERVIGGVILNNVSPSVAESISGIIEKELNIPVIGHLPAIKKDLLSSRHLGLVMPSEIPGVLAMIDEVAAKLEESLDVDRLIRIAGSAGEISAQEETGNDIVLNEPVRIGVARDEAFCFYYEDNLDMLREMGAQTEFFSPIHDKDLPKVSALIFGGGYPELYAKELSENESMLRSIRDAADRKMPILAECGGFLYLGKSLEDMDGECCKMAGVFEGEGFKTDRLSHFGYVNVEALKENPYLEKGRMIKGHEFHYFDTTDNGDVCDIAKPSGKMRWTGMKVSGNAFGGFAHLYYPSCPEFVKNFVSKAGANLK